MRDRASESRITPAVNDIIAPSVSVMASIQVGMLEGISGCTTGDNYGTAYMDIWLR